RSACHPDSRAILSRMAGGAEPAPPAAMSMHTSSPLAADPQIEIVSAEVSDSRKAMGRGLIVVASLLLAAILVVQVLYATDAIAVGFENWRPALYAFLLWSVALGVGQVLIRGEHGQRALFLLPAVLFTVAMVIFPTFFGLYIAFTDWNLSSFTGRQFN